MIYKIETNQEKYRNTMNRNDDWQATLDSYDGAPDASYIDSCIGTGKTELEAIKNLIDYLDGQSIYIDLSAIGLDGECDPYDYYYYIISEEEKREKEKRDCYLEDHRKG